MNQPFTQEVQFGRIRVLIEACSDVAVQGITELTDSFSHFATIGDYDSIHKVIVAIGVEIENGCLRLDKLRHHYLNGGYDSCWLYAPLRSRPTVDPRNILNCVEVIVSSEYADKGGVLLHAAAVCRRGAGFLFLGEGGAGKSTTAANSAAVNIPVIAEDRVLLGISDQGFVFSLVPTWPPQLSTHPELKPTLHGVFVLVKDDTDYLVPMGQTRTARMLFQAFQELPTSAVLPPVLQKKIYHLAGEIARRVPGYYLHLRKSPDFWGVIDAEFPD